MTTLSPNDSVVWASADPEKIVTAATRAAKRALDQKTRKPPAAIFDIDGTLLKNGDNDSYAVQPIGKQLYDWCLAHEIPVFIITARRKSPKALEYLKLQLTKLGYDLSAVKGVYMLSKEYDDHDHDGFFKESARAKLTNDYSIILNAGDKWSDVTNKTEPPKNVTRADVDMYMCVSPAEPGILQGIKFPLEE